VSNQAQIAFRGNKYSLIPGHSGEVVAVRHKLGTSTLDVTDRHGGEHVTALTNVVLANFSDRDPCRRETRRPPSAAALAEAERICRDRCGLGDGEHVVIDFAGYVEQARPFCGTNEQAGAERLPKVMEAFAVGIDAAVVEPSAEILEPGIGLESRCRTMMRMERPTATIAFFLTQTARYPHDRK
jgi:hypothetical protein